MVSYENGILWKNGWDMFVMNRQRRLKGEFACGVDGIVLLIIPFSEENIFPLPIALHIGVNSNGSVLYCKWTHVQFKFDPQGNLSIPRGRLTPIVNSLLESNWCHVRWLMPSQINIQILGASCFLKSKIVRKCYCFLRVILSVLYSNVFVCLPI